MYRGYCAPCNRRIQQQRGSAHARGYDKHWQRVRAVFLALHPWCADCSDKGLNVKAQEVHHITPLSEGGTHDEWNLMPLCKPCHSRRSPTVQR